MVAFVLSVLSLCKFIDFLAEYHEMKFRDSLTSKLQEGSPVCDNKTLQKFLCRYAQGQCIMHYARMQFSFEVFTLFGLVTLGYAIN